jgi:hypothetical protein
MMKKRSTFPSSATQLNLEENQARMMTLPQLVWQWYESGTLFHEREMNQNSFRLWV